MGEMVDVGLDVIEVEVDVRWDLWRGTGQTSMPAKFGFDVDVCLCLYQQ
jgi:hypothetical protein